MKSKVLLLVFVLSTFITINAQMTSCNSVVYDSFDNDGALPSEWTEYNTNGSVSVSGQVLTFNHSASKPSIYRTFDPVVDDCVFSFDVSTSRTSVNCQINLMSSTGKYLSTFVIGSGAASIKYATTMTAGVPSGFTDASPVLTLAKNTFFALAATVDMIDQTVDYYADGKLLASELPFLESAGNVAKIDIQSIYMWSNTGNFYFDNISLSTVDANRLELWYKIQEAEARLAAAVIGQEQGNSAQEDYDALQKRINVAKNAEATCSASKDQIDYIIDYLHTGIVEFEEAKVPLVQTISINAHNTKQKIVMVGGDMERNAHVLHDAPNKYQVIEWLIKDIPFNTYRVKYDKSQEMLEGEMNLDGAYAKQVETMKLIKQANPDIEFYATMKSDYNGYSQGNRNNLPTFIYDYEYDSSSETYLGTKSFDAVKYADFLADYIEYMSDNEVPISYLSTSKEWTQVMTATRAKETIETLISILSERNVAMPQIIDPGAWSINQGYNTVNNYVNADVNKYVYGYSTHNYSKSSKTWTDFSKVANEAGKIAIDDESGHGSGGPTEGRVPEEMPITTAIKTYSTKCEMYAGGMQGELIFELWMNNFKYARPIMFSSTENARRQRSYYLMKKHIENLRDATYVSLTMNNFTDVNSMAFIKDNSMVLWVINEGTDEYVDCEVDVSNFELKKGMTITQLYWDSTSIITGVEKRIMADANDEFKLDIGARSINCFVIAPYAYYNIKYLSNVEVESNMTMTVQPNPTTGLLRLNTSLIVLSVEVYDINGRVVLEMTLPDNQIDMSGLENGVYLLVVKTVNGIDNIRVIKE